jgi:protein SCO1/2
MFVVPHPRLRSAGRRVAAAACAASLVAGAAASPTDSTESPVSAVPSVAAPAEPGPESAFRLTPWPPRAVTPDFALIDADGRPRTLADYRGRVVVLFFGFARCPDVCPAELFKLALVMKQLGPLAADVQVLFVTLDPQRDTRKVLKDYVSAFDSRFVGLTGSGPQIDLAAANFYVVYARVPTGTDYTIDHSASTFVIDRAGRLRLVGPSTAAVADYAHDIALLVAEPERR